MVVGSTTRFDRAPVVTRGIELRNANSGSGRDKNQAAIGYRAHRVVCD